MKQILIPEDIQLVNPDGTEAENKTTFKEFLINNIKANKAWMKDVEMLGRAFILQDKINDSKLKIDLDDEDYDRIMQTYSLKQQNGDPLLNPEYVFQTRAFFEALTNAVDLNKIKKEDEKTPLPKDES